MEHSDSKPHRRKGEKEGRRLYPAERFKIWVGAFVQAWPIVVPILGLLGYTNKDHIANFVNGGPPVAEGEVVVPTQIPESLRLSLESFDAAITKLQDTDEALRLMIEVGDKKHGAASSKADIAQNKRLDALEELVQ